MSSDLSQTNEFIDSPDQVIQETPVAGNVFPEARNSIGAGHLSDESGNSSVLNSPLPTTPMASRLLTEQATEWGPTQDGSSNIIQDQDNALPRTNKRTPNLDRIIKFFKDNRSPQREGLLQKYEASELQDTPVSERKKSFPRSIRRESYTPGRPIVLSNGGHSHKSLQKYNESKESEESAFYLADINGSPKDKRFTNTKIVQQPSVSLHPSAQLRAAPNIDEKERPLAVMSHGSKAVPLRSQGIPTFGPDTENDSAPEIPPDQLIEASSHERLIMSRSRETDRERPDNNMSESSPLLALPTVSAANKEDDLSVEGNMLDNSRIDDTTEDNLPEMWVFRPGRNGVFNSNESTQVIKSAESRRQVKDITSQNKKIDDRSFTGRNFQSQTQVISSYATRDVSSQAKSEGKSQILGGEISSSTQVIQSPEHAFTTSLETPKGFPKINFEPILEVPETSSPSKSKDKLRCNSSPSPPEKERSNVETVTQADGTQETQHPKDPGKAGQILSQSGGDRLVSNHEVKDAVVVLSEPDLTQELPEIEDELTQGRHNEFSSNVGETDEDHISTKRRRRYGKTTGGLTSEGLTSEEESQSRRPPPKKKPRKGSIPGRDSDSNEEEQSRAPCVSLDGKEEAKVYLESKNDTSVQPQTELPTTVRERDDEYLSKEDIKFENSVWCQYSLDFNYYPGRVLSQNDQSDSCWVYFETGKSLTKVDDMHYLDLRVGETVNLRGKKHKVIALECRNHGTDVIRCIRGYDTVHLRRKKKSGSLGQKVIAMPLSVINLDLKEWTERPKIILESGSHTKAKAFEGLQRPIRGRKSATATLSPSKANNESRAERSNRPTYKEESDEDNGAGLKDDGTVFERSSAVPESLRILGRAKRLEGGKIFESCIFVLTGLSEDRQELSDVIESEGGEILDLGFSELFTFEGPTKRGSHADKYTLRLSWREDFAIKKYRFACLVTTRHLRSLKYLEALALGWPTLHWKFIRECLQKGRVCKESMSRYLLPSGDSYRLAFDTCTKSGVIKSNDIFQFHLKLAQGLPLQAQLDAMKSVMSDYKVIVYGQSELDHFIRFTLACLGVSDLYHLKGKITPTSFDEMQFLWDTLDDLLRDTTFLKVVIYVNKNNGISSELLNYLRDELEIKYQGSSERNLEFHVESKEWLIQTIINGSTGFES